MRALVVVPTYNEAPNVAEVLRDRFCSVGTYGGLYELLQRCR